jgi:hypothetical protein
MRRIDALDGSQVGDRWRGELSDEALLLDTRLPALPGLPRVLGMSMTAGKSCTLVTSLPSTISLQTRFGAEKRPITGTESVHVLLVGLPTLCAALGALHDTGHAHGTLDARTIIVDRRGNLSLRDLGFATTDAAGPAGDVRRLAAIVYKLLTGLPPLADPDGPPVPASVHNPAIPEPAATALTQALTGDIGDARTLARRLRTPAQPVP